VSGSLDSLKWNLVFNKNLSSLEGQKFKFSLLGGKVFDEKKTEFTFEEQTFDYTITKSEDEKDQEESF
jgi:hypothetical protein